MAHPCDICGPILKGILHPDEHQETHRGLKPYTCEACGRQFLFCTNFHQRQKQYSAEKSLRRDKGKTSFMKNRRVHEEPHLSEKPFICDEEQNNFQAGLGSHQQKATHSKRKTKSIESVGRLSYFPANSDTVKASRMRPVGSAYVSAQSTDLSKRILTQF